MRKPVIGAINGAAVGIGATLTLSFDIRIAAEGARYGFVFTRLSLVPEAASTFFLPRLVGMSRAMEWIATGRMLDAADVLSAGLVTRVCPDALLLDTAYVLAGEIRDTVAPVAFAAAKQMMWSQWAADGPWAAHRLETQVLDEMAASVDFTEGVRAFLERRKPVFSLSPIEDLPSAIGSWPRTG
jgi:enoyl-CoA hydratase/carnithine racemase